ncbi:hypothetical protein RRG08_062431 [Elysia crispata]|uniref:Uncharacterized protein n=1 Tax=Elysia crispata TaxID=231223 RepID=A0AAE0Z687_9GAST|nr:hypothetical protein RRG08_062431 [Elysia crispata]
MIIFDSNAEQLADNSKDPLNALSPLQCYRNVYANSREIHLDKEWRARGFLLWQSGQHKEGPSPAPGCGYQDTGVLPSLTQSVVLGDLFLGITWSSVTAQSCRFLDRLEGKALLLVRQGLKDCGGWEGEGNGGQLEGILISRSIIHLFTRVFVCVRRASSRRVGGKKESSPVIHVFMFGSGDRLDTIDWSVNVRDSKGVSREYLTTGQPKICRSRTSLVSDCGLSRGVFDHCPAQELTRFCGSRLSLVSDSGYVKGVPDHRTAQDLTRSVGPERHCF